MSVASDGEYCTSISIDGPGNGFGCSGDGAGAVQIDSGNMDVANEHAVASTTRDCADGEIEAVGEDGQAPAAEEAAESPTKHGGQPDWSTEAPVRKRGRPKKAEGANCAKKRADADGSKKKKRKSATKSKPDATVVIDADR